VTTRIVETETVVAGTVNVNRNEIATSGVIISSRHTASGTRGELPSLSMATKELLSGDIYITAQVDLTMNMCFKLITLIDGRSAPISLTTQWTEET